MSVALTVGGVLMVAAALGLTEACGVDRRSTEAETGASQASTPAPLSAAARRHRSHRYVSPAGSDRNDGSRSRPWRTLAQAAARVRPGVTVHVAPGEYAGPLLIVRGGTASRPVRFVSEQRWGARIRANSTDPISIVEIRGNHTRLEGFDVSGGGGAGTAGINVEGSYGAVANNHVHDLAAPCEGGGGGIVIGGGLFSYRNHDGLVAGNLVERIGTGPRDGSCRLVHGIYAAVRRVTILNNIVSQAIGDGITSWHAASELRIANNLTMTNGGTGILVGSGDRGARMAGNIRTLVSNNIVYGNALYGITETSDGRHGVGPGNRYLNNLTFANLRGEPRSGIRGLFPGQIVSGNIDADPRLAGTPGASPRYRPKPGSPALDAGTCAGAASHDFDGVRRPQGRAVDIGPYEQRSTPRRCGGD